MREFNYLKYQDYKWDAEIIKYVASIYKYAGKQELYLKQKPQKLEKLVQIAKIQSAESSNAIEGIVTTSSRVKQLVEEKTTPKNRDESEIAGYRDVLNIIHESSQYIPLTKNYILQLHSIMYKHMDNPLGGKTKNCQNYVKAVYSNGKEEILFTPLDPFETPIALEQICDQYNKSIESNKVEPLILIPIFIHDFLSIHPFNDGNGRMSRLLTTLLLYKSGFSVAKYISLEAKISQNKERYYESLKESQDNWAQGTNDVTPFIKYMLSIILAAYKDFEERCELISDKLPAIEIVKKAISTKVGKFTKQDIISLCPSLSKSSIEKSLISLVSQGFIKKNGEARATFYTRKDK